MPRQTGQTAADHHLAVSGSSCLPAAAGLLLLALAVYIPAMRGGFVWDDDDYVTENRTLRSLDGLGRIWFDIRATPQYYPLVFTSFWLEYHLWDSRPGGYHVVNILLHGTSAVLLWLVLRRLAVPGAWFAAAVFAVHPVHVESVAWITERKNVLSGVFYLSAALVWLRFAGLDCPRAAEPRRRSLYAIGLFLFACALLSKSVTASLPAALLLVLWWKRGRIARGDFLPLVPFFALGAVMGLITAWVERHHVGAEGAEWALSAAERCLIAGRALWFYAAKLIWPVRLTFIYPRWPIDSGVWWQYLYPIAAVAAIGLLWGLRRRIGRGPLVAVLFFAITLAPALGFFDVYPMRYSFVADHFQYHA
ncbi:MAG TPA: O-GlcNAc transferase, partial [Phycisphaerae bacterium]|nr:O-GlcNAc transferase [Phycisphaerae bacterium]